MIKTRSKNTYEYRYRIVMWVHYKLCGGKEGELRKPLAQFIFSILYPLHSWYAKQSQCHYDLRKDVYTIRGMKFSGRFFDWINNDAHIGSIVKISDHRGGECDITILSDEALESELSLRRAIKKALGNKSTQ